VLLVLLLRLFAHRPCCCWWCPLPLTLHLVLSPAASHQRRSAFKLIPQSVPAVIPKRCAMSLRLCCGVIAVAGVALSDPRRSLCVAVALLLIAFLYCALLRRGSDL
jgi:hypothetical protein